jgi:hypothetical protein
MDREDTAGCPRLRPSQGDESLSLSFSSEGRHSRPTTPIQKDLWDSDLTESQSLHLATTSRFYPLLRRFPSILYSARALHAFYLDQGLYSQAVGAARTHHEKRGTASTAVTSVENLTCRGRANLLVWFIQLDELALPLRFFKVEARPGPGASRVRTTYDPNETDEDAVKRAITEAFFQVHAEATDVRWFASPFRVAG